MNKSEKQIFFAVGGAFSAMFASLLILLMSSFTVPGIHLDFSSVLQTVSVVVLIFLAFAGLVVWKKKVPEKTHMMMFVAGLLIWLSISLVNFGVGGFAFFNVALLNLAINFVFSMVSAFVVPFVGTMIRLKLDL